MSLTVAVKVTPKARHAGVLGIAPGKDGTPLLRLAVTEPPDQGRANDAVLRLLADRLGVAPSACTLLRGAGSREKLIRVDGDAGTLSARLAALGR
ncbi:DUF167 domain-containing protein [Elioraea sp.]|uniref:DUF167 domain-containing protein n=1 Tax=Elioraea sp. TaxID=2185103 RepID=UPI003F6E56D4